jgi:hypothetical protein
MRDVFQAAFLPKSKGRGEELFIDKVDKGRLVFLFCVDYFIVEHSCLRRSRASSGMITITRSNLSLYIRHFPGNVFLVGIVPGPRERNGTAIDSYLSPLVDELRIFSSWETGFRCSRTTYGRGAIVVEIRDLPGSG